MPNLVSVKTLCVHIIFSYYIFIFDAKTELYNLKPSRNEYAHFTVESYNTFPDIYVPPFVYDQEDYISRSENLQYVAHSTTIYCLVFLLSRLINDC